MLIVAAYTVWNMQFNARLALVIQVRLHIWPLIKKIWLWICMIIIILYIQGSSRQSSQDQITHPELLGSMLDGHFLEFEDVWGLAWGISLYNIIIIIHVISHMHISPRFAATDANSSERKESLLPFSYHLQKCWNLESPFEEDVVTKESLGLSDSSASEEEDVHKLTSSGSGAAERIQRVAGVIQERLKNLRDNLMVRPLHRHQWQWPMTSCIWITFVFVFVFCFLKSLSFWKKWQSSDKVGLVLKS